jgi:type II secretory pathway component PulJ
MGRVILAVVLFSGVLVIAFALVRAAKAQSRPSRDLVQAVRLLDRILAYDDAVSALSVPLRTETQQFTARFYKEIQ